ncbi:MAG: RNA polymerase sigma factor [Actinomycetes bacterium]
MPQPVQQSPALADLERVYRTEAAQLRGALAHWLGDLDLAEELLQEAMVEAAEHWPVAGVPANPGGWLATTAKRKGIDRLRREQVGREKLALIAQSWSGPAEDSDDLLGLIFACCSPELPRESQVALTLRSVCGLTTAEVAAAYLQPEATMSQRLTRAKRLLQERGVRFAVPDPDEFGDRLDEVLGVVYLLFNEGYLTSSRHEPARRDLAATAQWLADLLHRLMPREPEVLGLRALIILHQARAATRFDGWGRLVQLADQDRAGWDRAAINAALELLDTAMAMRRPGPYQLQAAIAALHAQSASYPETDWLQIRLLYDRLDQLAPSPVVRLNRAVATRYTEGAAVALAELDALDSELRDYRLWHAVRGELLRELGRSEEARLADKRALELATNPAERELLARRLGQASAPG